MFYNLDTKTKHRLLRKNRVRSVVTGTKDRPRLTVYISNNNVTAQIIDDTVGKTLVYVSSVGQKEIKGNLSQKAEIIGAEIAKLAKTKKIKKIVFDRNGRIYHGRIKLLAEAARKNGLEF